MKKILLASTILVGTAGFAAAGDITFTGKAMFGGAAAWTGGILTAAGPTIDSSFKAGMMTTTTGGLEAGATITVNAIDRTIKTDNTSGSFGTISSGGGTISEANAYLKGDWGKVAVTYDANAAGIGDDEIKYAYTNTWGNVSVLASYQWDASGTDDATLGVKYASGDYKVYARADFVQAPGWTFNNVDFGGSYTMSGFTGAVDATYDLSPALLKWKVSAKYAVNPYSFGVFVQKDDAGAALDYGANASYDLGGGVSINGAAIHDADLNRNLVTGDVSMKF